SGMKDSPIPPLSVGACNVARIAAPACQNSGGSLPMNAVSPRSSTELRLAYLPIFLDVRDRVVLLIGGGEGAQAKLDLLRRAEARVRLVSPHGDAVCAAADIEPELGALKARHFEGVALAVDASGNP